ncbi:MAG: Y-family DNA polymerase [Chroococcidiopsidaceae cyanobacterium CP_BM_RX_35]|nr:Y-family DNA polymerase [Chroococcidiopsidaceae cyanobacterium CP_BM_RX_35]
MLGKEHCTALIDCNSFYASCEAVFEPRLWELPLVVLSNNDGCVVSLNGPAKALECVDKGKPFFQIRHLIYSRNLVAKSSNFALYGDMSSRVMTTLKLFSPAVQIYSIDEAFLSLEHISSCYRTEYAHQIRATVRQYTGIPINIGVAETKTLAKVANRYAKRVVELEGVLDITNNYIRQEELLATLAIEDVWGIGYRWGKMLLAEGIDTALKLRDLPDWFVKKHMGVVGLRLVFELRGISCLPIESHSRPRQSCMVSRSFGRPVKCQRELEEAIATFTARAARKLRQEHLAAGALSVFANSSRFKDNYYSKSGSCHLLTATNHTPVLVRYALTIVSKLWRDNVEFAKAGVILTRLTDQDMIQLSLFDDYDPEDERPKHLMELIDGLDEHFGRETLKLAAMGLNKHWQTRAQYMSKRWTTRWDEIPLVKC